jgi:carboxyl-terminal processing protease
MSRPQQVLPKHSARRAPLLLLGGLLIIICLCLSYTAGFGVYRLWNELVEQTRHPRPLGVFWEAWERIEHYFYGELPSPRERTYGAIRETLVLLNDPYTIFVEPQPRELERDHMRGFYGGIGVALQRDEEGQTILSPYPDSPAKQTGVYDGDILLAIDDITISNEASLDDIRSRLRGEIGTAVTLTLSRSHSGDAPPTPPFDMVVIRGEIRVPSVTWRVLEQAPDVGYIRIERFTERTSSEILPPLQELQQAKLIGLILDLRDNSGGLIDSAVTVASQFLNDGVVLYHQVGHEQECTSAVQEDGIATDIPLAVLVNGKTASAAEIVASALQDHGRAPLIGESTFGKGSMQLVYDLSDGSSLHVTSAIWLTPDRHQIQGRGLTPDIYIPHSDDPGDKQLDRAVDYLQSR